MRETTDALELLTEQHDEVLGLFDEIEECEDVDEQSELFAELADKLAAHAMIEEKIFYPSVLTEETAAQLVAATEEHLAAKRVIADMLGLDPEDEHWAAKLTVLHEEIRHHAKDEEEAKLFPMVRRAMSDAQLAALGTEMRAMFDELVEGEPRMQVPAEIDEAAPLVLGV